MSKSNDSADLVLNAEQRLGRIDILVNNAGIQFIAPIARGLAISRRAT